MNTPHIIIRDVLTDELRIVRVPVGFAAKANPAYRWAGFFKSIQEAKRVLASKDEKVRCQLYGEPRPIDGTPGPEAVAELFRIGDKR